MLVDRAKYMDQKLFTLIKIFVRQPQLDVIGEYWRPQSVNSKSVHPTYAPYL